MTSSQTPTASAGSEAIDATELRRILADELTGWTETSSFLAEDESKTRVELTREFKFESFRKAIEFMGFVAPGCDARNHHPRWENNWKTVRVHLTSWDIGHRISDRDLQLARYFDLAYSEFISSR